jgi:hypothetical protein
MTDPVAQDGSASTDGDAFRAIFGITHLHIQIV